MKKNFIAFFFLFFYFSNMVQAQTYEPGRGILLPRSGGQNAPVQVAPGSNSPTVIQRGQIIKPQGNNGAPLVVNPRVSAGQGENKNSDAQKMTAAYAAHLYTGMCSQEYRETIAPKTEPNLDMQKLWNDVQTSCKCLSNEILGVIPAPDLADYVMYNYSSQTSGGKNQDRIAYQQSAQTGQIGVLASNPALRKKCGFLK